MDKNTMNRRMFVGASVAGVGLVAMGGVVALSVKGKKVDEKADGGLGQRFEYDLGALVETDESLIKFSDQGVVAGEMGCVRDMVVADEDQIVVATDRRVVVMDGGGQWVREIDCDGQPRCVGVDDAGRLLVGLKDGVVIYDGKGKQIDRWPTFSGQPHLTNLAIETGMVFVADAGNRVVWRCDMKGEVVGEIGRKDLEKGVAGLILPSPYFAVAVDREQEILWVANTGRHCVEGYTFTGELVSKWGRASMAIDGFCGCCNPCHFVLMKDGRFLTSEKGLPRVKIYDAAGELESVVAGAEQFVNEGGDVVLGMNECEGRGPIAGEDGQGGVIIYHPRAGEIRRYQPI